MTTHSHRIGQGVKLSNGVSTVDLIVDQIFFYYGKKHVQFSISGLSIDTLTLAYGGKEWEWLDTGLQVSLSKKKKSSGQANINYKLSNGYKIKGVYK